MHPRGQKGIILLPVDLLCLFGNHDIELGYHLVSWRKLHFESHNFVITTAIGRLYLYLLGTDRHPNLALPAPTGRLSCVFLLFRVKGFGLFSAWIAWPQTYFDWLGWVKDLLALGLGGCCGQGWIQFGYLHFKVVSWVGLLNVWVLICIMLETWNRTINKWLKPSQYFIIYHNRHINTLEWLQTIAFQLIFTKKS